MFICTHLENKSNFFRTIVALKKKFDLIFMNHDTNERAISPKVCLQQIHTLNPMPLATKLSAFAEKVALFAVPNELAVSSQLIIVDVIPAP